VLAHRVLATALIVHVIYGMLLGIGFSMMTYRVLGRGGFALVRPRHASEPFAGRRPAGNGAD
jgi:hypothetical protein